ncbi:hypothetical protein [Desulfovibrio sp. SGI.169]|uniref:hypothetical protein n=1 Tax=Desulfovibrio sp. SGI.169 TaxID=3420561 RepID=UPI003D040240
MAFFDIVTRWAVNRQKKDLQSMADVLKGMDNEELFFIYKGVKETGIALQNKMHLNVYKPFLAIEQDKNITQKLKFLIKKSSEQNEFELSSAFSIWLFTIRAAISPELRFLGKEIWEYLGKMEDDISFIPEGFRSEKITERQRLSQLMPKSITKKHYEFSNKNNEEIILSSIKLMHKVIFLHPKSFPMICGESAALSDFILCPLLENKKDNIANDEFAIDVILPLIEKSYTSDKVRAYALNLSLLMYCENYIFNIKDWNIIKNMMIFNKYEKFMYAKSYFNAIPSFAKNNIELINKKAAARGIPT